MRPGTLRRQSKRKRREIRESRPVVAEVIERDGGCVLRSTTVAGPCWGGPTPHHLEKQSRKPGGWTPRNLMTLCAGHNGWVEDHPIAALRLGLVVNGQQSHWEAWAAMRTHCLAAGRLEEPCPCSGMEPEQWENGRAICPGCGLGAPVLVDRHGVLVAEGDPGVLPGHDRELGW